jgi:hypothetical protein
LGSCVPLPSPPFPSSVVAANAFTTTEGERIATATVTNAVIIIVVMSANTIVGNTTIQLEEETRDRLKAFGKKGEIYDDIVIRLMDHYEGKARK